MPFRYEAYNREAQLVRGTIDVETREAAEQSLWEGDVEDPRKRAGIQSLIPH